MAAPLLSGSDRKLRIGASSKIVGENATLQLNRVPAGVSRYVIPPTVPPDDGPYEISLQASVQNPSQTAGERMGGDVGYTNDLYLAGARDYDGGVGGTGIVRVFNSSGALLYNIDAPNQGEGGQFGEQIATYDGYALISANNESVSGQVTAGKVYLYQLGPSSATLQQTFVDPGTPAIGASFGGIIDLSADYVLSMRQDNGECFIFTRAGALIRTFTADSLGEDWKIYGDYIVRGRRLNDDAGTNSGDVVLYKISDGSTVYTKSSPSPFANGELGSAVAINSTYFAASEPDQTIATPGKVHVWRISDGTLVNSFVSSGDTGTNVIRLGEHADGANVRGRPMTFAGDNSPILWVSRQRVNNNTGRVYVFNVETGEQLYLIENPNDAYPGANAEFDAFGTSLSFDGRKGIIGAWGAENSIGNPAAPGAVYIYG